VNNVTVALVKACLNYKRKSNVVLQKSVWNVWNSTASINIFHEITVATWGSMFLQQIFATWTQMRRVYEFLCKYPLSSFSVVSSSLLRVVLAHRASPLYNNRLRTVVVYNEQGCILCKEGPLCLPPAGLFSRDMRREMFLSSYCVDWLARITVARCERKTLQHIHIRTYGYSRPQVTVQQCGRQVNNTPLFAFGAHCQRAPFGRQSRTRARAPTHIL